MPEIEHPRARPAGQVVEALVALGLDAESCGSVETGFASAESRREPLVAFGTFAVAGGVLALLTDP